MSEIARTSSRSRWEVIRSSQIALRLGYACLLLLIALLGTWIVHQETEKPKSMFVTGGNLLPNPRLTPGRTKQVKIDGLCSVPNDEVVRRVPDRLQQEVFREYGVPGTRAAEYEIDYLITPGLGGSEDIRNLWPQPRRDASWSSYVKDRLEEHLHHLVCAGQLDLASAQHQIAGNWIVTYKKYFEASGQPFDSLQNPADVYLRDM